MTNITNWKITNNFHGKLKELNGGWIFSIGFC